MEPIEGAYWAVEGNASRLSPAELSRKARSLLAGLLKERYGLPRLPAMAVGSNGKPYFPEHPEIRFSLSHCRGAVMAVVSDREVGCDVEDVQADAPEELLRLAFSEEECKRIREAEDSGLELTRIWTRKESAVKMRGAIPDDPRQWPSDHPATRTEHLPHLAACCSITTK